eukprot:TRINITY_DN2731_c0_g1_i1.p1 TRINITY_DN2731_c0_g1~~TRINITY_DN2731_c0_g1_i1.p1  ORF type:complete len:320 (+),score=103.96 TRINITY_DN2731_c0_g1_i1:181-1140(+)
MDKLRTFLLLVAVASISGQTEYGSEVSLLNEDAFQIPLHVRVVLAGLGDTVKAARLQALLSAVASRVRAPESAADTLRLVYVLSFDIVVAADAAVRPIDEWLDGALSAAGSSSDQHATQSGEVAVDASLVERVERVAASGGTSDGPGRLSYTLVAARPRRHVTGYVYGDSSGSVCGWLGPGRWAFVDVACRAEPLGRSGIAASGSRLPHEAAADVRLAGLVRSAVLNLFAAVPAASGRPALVPGPVLVPVLVLRDHTDDVLASIDVPLLRAELGRLGTASGADITVAAGQHSLHQHPALALSLATALRAQPSFRVGHDG